MKRESNEMKQENDRAASFKRFCEVVRHLRAEDGCPWDRAQTHTSLKPYCIEEAAEVIGGINIWEATGDAENLKEELGDLMLQILLHAQIAEEEGLFTIREVMDGASEKMIRRHPHVFGKSMLSEQVNAQISQYLLKRSSELNISKIENCYHKYTSHNNNSSQVSYWQHR